MNIAFVASEIAPYAKTGGLADVSGALPKYIAARGNDVRVFMPFFSTIDTSMGDFHEVEFIRNVPIQFGADTIHFTAYVTTMPGSDVDLYLIDCPRLYHRGTVYTDDRDEYLRFALLSRAAIECCQRMGFPPRIFHCNDWQTALVPLFLRTVYNWDQLFTHTRTVLTIHNIGYQGVFSSEVIDHIGLGDYRDKLDQNDLNSGVVNYLKTGIFYSDMLTTVSNTYAHEIQTEEFGAGLEGLLQARRSSLFGIVNGVDYNEWSPEKDAFIPHHFSIDDLSGKQQNKQMLMQRLELDYDPDAPLIGIVSRLTGQKGMDLFFEIMMPVLNNSNARFAILGSGERKYEDFFTLLMHQYRDRVCFYRGFQNELAHLIEAGADIFLMPSKYEPCGLNQIYSLRYGTIPVVRKTGGLADTVQQFDPQTGEGTGFVFEHFTSFGLQWAMENAIRTYYYRDAWSRLMHNAMSQNYSWEVQVEKYLWLYEVVA
jgi:starch synthase